MHLQSISDWDGAYANMPNIPGGEEFPDIWASRATEFRSRLAAAGHSRENIAYGDTERMTTLSRGVDPLWISEQDAEEIGVADNDWVEVYNDHGVVVTRAAVSARIPPGICTGTGWAFPT